MKPDEGVYVARSREYPDDTQIHWSVRRGETTKRGANDDAVVALFAAARALYVLRQDG